MTQSFHYFENYFDQTEPSHLKKKSREHFGNVNVFPPYLDGKYVVGPLSSHHVLKGLYCYQRGVAQLPLQASPGFGRRVSVTHGKETSFQSLPKNKSIFSEHTFLGAVFYAQSIRLAISLHMSTWILQIIFFCSTYFQIYIFHGLMFRISFELTDNDNECVCL